MSQRHSFLNESAHILLRTFAAATDVDRWLAIRHSAFAGQDPPVRPWTREDFDREVRSRWWWIPRFCWFAWRGELGPNNPLGTAMLGFRGEPHAAVPVIHWLAVARPYWGLGIGGTLIAHVEAQAFYLGYRILRLETHANWREAVRLYWGRGYRPVSAAPRHAPDAEVQ